MTFDLNRRFLAVFLSVACVVAALPASCAEINVFAAASLTDSLKEIALVYEKASEDRVVFNFAASSTLARQIDESAPADIFFSADEARMDALEKKGLLESGTRKSLLSNTLVIVVATDSDLKIDAPEDLANPMVKRVALADPAVVPAGVYSKEFLAKRKLWAAVQGKVIPTENVRAALAAVESGNVDAGMVYQTDAAVSKKVKVAYQVPSGEGPSISYPVAIIKGSRHRAAALRFAAYLESPQALRIFRNYGFITLK